MFGALGSLFGSSLLGGLGDFFSGRDAAEEQMDFNAEQAAKNRAFQERMSNTEIQRRSADLQKAGFNPIMAVGSLGGASSPSGSAASSGAMPTSGFQASQMQSAQIELLKAQSDKARSEAEMARQLVPYNAANVVTNSEQLSANLVKTGQEIEKLSYEIKQAQMNTEQLGKMQPLLLEGQRLLNQGMRFGLGRKELEEKASDFLGIPFKYGAEAVKYLNELGSGIGIKSHEAMEWFKSLPQKWDELRRQPDYRR